MKLLFAFSTALYKSLQYLPHTALWIIANHYKKSCTNILRLEIEMKRLVGRTSVTIRTKVYVQQLSSELKWSSPTGFVDVLF
jgi:hypothetical protein